MKTKKVFIPVLDRDGLVLVYGSKYYTDLLECLYFINAVRGSLGPGEIIYYKTLTLAE